MPTRQPIIPDPANVPELLKQHNHWICWRYEIVDGRETKVPYRCQQKPHKAATDNPDTWSDFDTALESAVFHSGIGFVITPDLGLVGADIDNCIEDGKPNSFAEKIICTFDTFTETSPSGKGYRLWMQGTLPPGGRRKGSFEIYNSGRYLTVTGNHLIGQPTGIEQRQSQIEQVMAEIFPPKPPREARDPVQVAELQLTDRELLDKAFGASNGADVEALWNGQFATDHSAADLSLCNHLAFYCGPNGDGRLDYLFRQSGLMRPKWDERRRADGATYGQMTIEKAYSDITEFYEQSDFVDLRNNQSGERLEKNRNVGSDVGSVSNTPKDVPNGNNRTPQSQKREKPTAEWDENAKCWNVGGFDGFSDSPIGLELGDQIPFPKSALPENLLTYIEEVTKVVQVPIEMPAMMALATCAAAVSRKWQVKIGRTHEEPTCLYIAVAAEPGARKSQALSAVQFPLQDYERELLRMHEDTKSDAEQAVAEATHKAAEIQKALQTERDEEKRKTLADDLKAAKRQVSASVPPEPRLLVDDITQEKLAQRLIESNGCLAMLSDEGGIFDILAGRYSDGMNLDLFLKAHDGGSFRVDRLNRPGEHIERACMTIGLCVQPDVIQRALGNKKEFKGRGLLGRFLFAIPTDLRGRRLYDPKAPGINEELKHDYGVMVRTLLRYPAMNPQRAAEMHTLRMDEDALTIHARLMNDIEARQGLDRDLRPFADWASKLAGKVARIAAVLHCVKYYEDRPESTLIDSPTILSAWRIGSWLIAHMKEAYGLAQDSEVSLLAAKILDWLRAHNKRLFQNREITVQFHKDGDKEFRERSLDYLRDLGWIKGPQAFTNAKTGRPIEFYACALGYELDISNMPKGAEN